MGSNSGLKAQDEAIRELAFGSVTSSHANLGGVLLHKAGILTIFNNLDVDIYVSFDGGSTDHKKIPTGVGRVWDYQANDMFKASGIQIAVKDDGTPATTGWVVAEVTFA